MKNTLLLFLMVATIAGCSKSKDDSPENNSITGAWKLEMKWIYDGNGSGKWETYIGDPVVIQFYEDGSFTDSRQNNVFNRYQLNGDILKFSNSSYTLQMSVQDLNTATLAYHVCDPLYCGIPYGEKFVRVTPITID